MSIETSVPDDVFSEAEKLDDEYAQESSEVEETLLKMQLASPSREDW